MQEEALEEALKICGKAVGECDWTAEEFNREFFKDIRIYRRFLVVAKHLSEHPQAFINQAHENWPMTKAAYRFFDNKNVSSEEIIEAHRSKTLRRMALQTEPVLVIQDTSFLNYTHMKVSSDLGPIGEKKSNARGLVMHTAMAVSSQGLPLGIVEQDIWAREIDTQSELEEQNNVVLEEKESSKWFNALRSYGPKIPKDCRVITVGDRESDIYEFMIESKKQKTNFLIRAKNDRATGGTTLWPYMLNKPVAKTYELELQETTKRAARIAKMELRYAQVTINPPKRLPNEESITIWAIYTKEIQAPQGTEPVEWLLLTDLKTTTCAQALTRIGWYKVRWRIETFHKILKSGCAIELSRLEKNTRRFPLIALKSVIAWRLLLMTYYFRIFPNQTASDILSSTECRALYAIINNHVPDKTSFSARTAIRWLAQLGGFLARNLDNEPGPVFVWRGWQRLQDFTRAFQLAWESKAF